MMLSDVFLSVEYIGRKLRKEGLGRPKLAQR